VLLVDRLKRSLQDLIGSGIHVLRTDLYVHQQRAGQICIDLHDCTRVLLLSQHEMDKQRAHTSHFNSTRCGRPIGSESSL
jgi:hypothetical protein